MSKHEQLHTMTNLKVKQTSPTTWDVYLGDQKLDCVRSLQLNLAVDCIPTANIEVLLDNADIETDARIEYNDRNT